MRGSRRRLGGCRYLEGIALLHSGGVFCARCPSCRAQSSEPLAAVNWAGGVGVRSHSFTVVAGASRVRGNHLLSGRIFGGADSTVNLAFPPENVSLVGLAVWSRHNSIGIKGRGVG